MPDVVKYGISNFTWMGGLPSVSSLTTLGRPKWARIKYSLPPCESENEHVMSISLRKGSAYAGGEKNKGKPLKTSTAPGSTMACQQMSSHSPEYAWRFTKAMTYRKRFDTPNENVLLGDVADTADGSFELGRVGVGRNWHHHFDVVGSRAPLELRACLDHVLDARMSVPLDDRFNPNQRLHLQQDTIKTINCDSNVKRNSLSYMSVQPIGHELKFPIWRNEGDCPVVFKSIPKKKNWRTLI